MSSIPSQEELRAAFLDFAHFTFDLIDRIEKDTKYLKFAAVNAQITLELFLKYYYVKLGQVSQIQKKKSGKLIPDFEEFSQILNHFYSSRSWSFGTKKEFVKLMETRNSIVHRGQKAGWDRIIAKYIIRTLFFIHSTAWSDLGETLFFDNYTAHPIANNKIWREGSESFVADLESIYEVKALTCLECGAHSVITGEVMVLEDGHTEEDLICLNCLTSVNTECDARLITCYNCSKKSYLLDALNEQDNQLYIGICSECRANNRVRRCANCEDFYHPTSVAEVLVESLYFCSPDCAEMFAERDA